MKNGLQICHYPHRSIIENISYFTSHGFESVCLYGQFFSSLLEDTSFVDTLKKTGAILTVHAKLPLTHKDADVADFKDFILKAGNWQKKHKLLSVLSFDVADEIRDNIAPYIDFVLENISECKIAVEDFGLTADERGQIEHLKGNGRFGYLIDIGHMYIRLIGKSDHPATLFHNFADECPKSENPDLDDFKKAFTSKEFPIYEIHLHNNDGISDLHRFYHDGYIDMKIIAQLFKEINFDGIVTCESAPGYLFDCFGKDADDGVLEAYTYWKKLLFS